MHYQFERNSSLGAERRLVFQESPSNSGQVETVPDSGEDEGIAEQLTDQLKKLKGKLKAYRESNTSEEDSLKESLVRLQKQLTDAKDKLSTATGAELESLMAAIRETFANLHEIPDILKGDVEAALEQVSGHITNIQSGVRSRINETLSGTERAFNSIGGFFSGMFAKVEMPEWMRRTWGSAENFGKWISEKAQRLYYGFMANLDKNKLVPAWAISLFSGQIEGSRAMLVMLDAKDGLRDALKSDSSSHGVKWDDLAWEGTWKPAYEKAKAETPGLTPHAFMKREISKYLAGLPDDSTGEVSLKDIQPSEIRSEAASSPSPSPSPTPSPTSSPTPSPTTPS